MSLCNTYFGKEREDLTYQDIVNYFLEPKEESDKIEFKSFSDRENLKKQYDPVCRTISAFLNSAGGILIWGAPAGKEIEGKKEKIFKGDLAPINEVLEQDALVSKLSDLINPLNNNIKVKILPNEDTCVCVFEIERDFHTAHQFKNTYYMRLDGQTRAAPHHYIEALMKQVKYPDLGGYLKINSFNQDRSNRFLGPNMESYILNLSLTIFNWSIVQNELNLNVSMACDKYAFNNYTIGSPLATGYSYANSGHILLISDANNVLHYGFPFVYSQTIIISKPIIAQFSNFEIILMFGGRYSPMKTSTFEIDLRRYNTESLSDIIINKKLNAFMSDDVEEKGITKKNQLDDLLGYSD